MENIYKVKIRTDPDPRGLYPSERRYSASTVLGLGVIHLWFALLALIFASLNLLSGPYTAEMISKLIEGKVIIARNKEAVDYVGAQEVLAWNAEVSGENATSDFLYNKTIVERRKRDVISSLESIPYVYLTIAGLIMFTGALLEGLTALLAWKRWYIDNNIKWFFLSSCISNVTSSLSLTLTIVTIIITFEKIHEVSRVLTSIPHFKLGLSVHILIESFLEFMWSALSTRLAFRGMKNTYPDDIMVGKGRGGKIEVNTVRKGNKKTKIVPPDILSHFHVTEKFAKYFPRKESSYLPKEESNSEYQERVRKFLSSNTDTSSVK